MHSLLCLYGELPVCLHFSESLFIKCTSRNNPKYTETYKTVLECHKNFHLLEKLPGEIYKQERCSPLFPSMTQNYLH